MNQKMKIRYITTALLAAGLTTGCINIKIYPDSKPKHHEGKECEDQDDEKGEHESKCKKHEEKESRGHEEDEKGEHESKGKHHEKKEREEKEDEKDGHESEAKMKARAKISQSDARATALALVPNGTIKEAELENEKGKLIWSFDMSTPGTENTTEVNVDAINGKVVSKEIETPKSEAKEKDDDEKGEKKDKD